MFHPLDSEGGSTISSIISNYTKLQELWEEARQVTHNTEAISGLNGVAAVMNSCVWCLLLGESILNHTYNLSKSLYKERLPDVQGQNIISKSSVV